MPQDRFNIIKVETHPKTELIEKLRQVTMLKDRAVRPYAECRIALERLPFTELRPAQRYVLLGGLLKAKLIADQLRDLGHDTMELDGYLSIWTDKEGGPFDLLPPMVETHREANGFVNNIVCDGMHRLYAARMEWRVPTVVRVQGLPEACPYYAYPLPGPEPWESVGILTDDSIPGDYLKKWHRIQDNKLLYRDFESAFRNVGGPRGGGAA
ncbi:MAG: hypothetical protein LBF40_07665 [Deltaproteobacteria bacterium]|jgi:hypothetical protein|nr:hypothetical protein [Deltaproteobacteria bacterium]